MLGGGRGCGELRVEEAGRGMAERGEEGGDELEGRLGTEEKGRGRQGVETRGEGEGGREWR